MHAVKHAYGTVIVYVNNNLKNKYTHQVIN